ncbi:hypothetical protein [Methylomagnum sp.]
MLNTLRLPHNRPYLRGIVLAVLAWLALTLSATCVMPLWGAVPTAMTACLDSSGPHPAPISKPDCSFKSCLESQSGPVFAANPDRSPEPPLAILCLVWIVGGWFQSQPALRAAWRGDPPSGRRIPLIYLFRVLLN